MNPIVGQCCFQTMRDVRAIADKYGIRLVLDASLLGENAYLVKQREEEFKEKSMAEILLTFTGMADIIYFSARKLSSSRGGGICTNDLSIYKEMEALVPLFEGFLTYGGISIREVEAMAVGLYETLDETMISQSPSYIKYLVEEAKKLGIPMITPPGVLGAHADYPVYNWLSNKGYPTIQHRNAIREFGISPHHRKSFRLLQNQTELEF